MTATKRLMRCHFCGAPALGNIPGPGHFKECRYYCPVSHRVWPGLEHDCKAAGARNPTRKRYEPPQITRAGRLETPVCVFDSQKQFAK
jgi:hypothetical protein